MKPSTVFSVVQLTGPASQTAQGIESLDTIVLIAAIVVVVVTLAAFLLVGFTLWLARDVPSATRGTPPHNDWARSHPARSRPASKRASQAWSKTIGVVRSIGVKVVVFLLGNWIE